MPVFAIDTELARVTGSALIRAGDETYDTALELHTLATEMRLGLLAAHPLHCLDRAVSGLWAEGTVMHLLADAAESGDVLDRATVGRLGAVAAGLVGGSRSPSLFLGWLLGRTPGLRSPISSIEGEPGQTYARELRSPYTIFGDGADAARSVLMRAIADTADRVQIRGDEFGLVQLDAATFIVVLPGVTDLSRPQLGLSPTNRTVRDLDQHAIRSWRSTSVADNRYAEMVWEGLARADVPVDAKLMIVGHSYGADTALDLAADPRFNGDGGFAVTHVVAAGYDSEPQLRAVPTSTEVLVLQNNRDATVIAERLGRSAGVDSVIGAVELSARLATGRGGAAAGELSWRVATSSVRAVGGFPDAARSAYNRRGDVVAIGRDLGSLDVEAAANRAAEMGALEPGIERIADHVIVDVFEGGDTGVGHDQANYLDHVAAVADPMVLAFFESVAAGGYARSGPAVAVDVSVPTGLKRVSEILSRLISR